MHWCSDLWTLEHKPRADVDPSAEINTWVSGCPTHGWPDLDPPDTHKHISSTSAWSTHTSHSLPRLTENTRSLKLSPTIWNKAVHTDSSNQLLGLFDRNLFGGKTHQIWSDLVWNLICGQQLESCCLVKLSPVRWPHNLWADAQWGSGYHRHDRGRSAGCAAVCYTPPPQPPHDTPPPRPECRTDYSCSRSPCTWDKQNNKKTNIYTSLKVSTLHK